MASNQQEEDQGLSFSTVEFNVGGKLYEVSISLLQGFPNTVLAEKTEGLGKASSPSTPIFIDRDPDRFAFCLDYMRDNGVVHLPETVPKAAFLKDLEFLGFVDIDENKIHDEESEQNCLTRFHQITEVTKQRILRLEREAEALEKDVNERKEKIEMEKVAFKCLKETLRSPNNDVFVHEDYVTRFDILNRRSYFLRCCDKLALEVIWSDPKVLVKRKTSKQGAKLGMFQRVVKYKAPQKNKQP